MILKLIVNIRIPVSSSLLNFTGVLVMLRLALILLPVLLLSGLSKGLAQPSSSRLGNLRGTVTLGPADAGIRNAVVTIIELHKSVLTDDRGAFEFIGIPAGRYQFVAHLDRVPDVIKKIE